jgi:hypothetical protein
LDVHKDRILEFEGALVSDTVTGAQLTSDVKAVVPLSTNFDPPKGDFVWQV